MPQNNCGRDIESATNFILHCPLFVDERSTFFNTLSSLDCNPLDNADCNLTQALPFGNTSFKSSKNLKILIPAIYYPLSIRDLMSLCFKLIFCNYWPLYA